MARHRELVPASGPGLRAIHELVDETPRRRFVGECAIDDRYPAMVAEWERFDAVLNEVLAEADPTMVCCYDLARLPRDVVERAGRSHPLVGLVEETSPDYVEPSALLAAHAPIGPVPSTAKRAGPAATAPAARLVVRDALGPAHASLDTPSIAATELVSNAWAAGALHVGVSCWCEDGSVAVQVDDDGPGVADLLAGYRMPSAAQLHGRGLWIVRQLADTVELDGAAGSTSVRPGVRAGRIPSRIGLAPSPGDRTGRGGGLAPASRRYRRVVDFPRVDGLLASAFTVPTDGPGQDGTADWDSTTLVVVELRAGDRYGLGYTYGPAAIANFVEGELAPVVRGSDPSDISATWEAMGAAVRNAGRPGIAMMAISAVDVALWDLKARILGLPVVALLHPAHDAVPIYGSGGFTCYSIERLSEQVGGWVGAGIPRVKVKTSRHPAEDPARLDAVRAAAGPATDLFCDANGALTRKRALYWAGRFADEWDVRWFEEPVSSEDLGGLRLLRDRAPAGMDIAAGEYGYLLSQFRDLLLAGAVDCLQADVTRCGGISGMLRVAALCDVFQLEISGHCAPALSAHALCGAVHLRHLEYFCDHVRLEAIAFDGVLDPVGGELRPDRGRPGLGLELKRADLERYRVV